MIYIKKNTRNIIGLTLFESSRITDPFYSFHFISDGLKSVNEIFFTAPDVAAYPNRLNIFILKEGTTGSKTSANGFISTPPEVAHLNIESGQYTYKVYETSTLIEGIDDLAGLNPIEVGRMSVQLTEDEEDKGQNNNQRDVYK